MRQCLDCPASLEGFPPDRMRCDGCREARRKELSRGYNRASREKHVEARREASRQFKKDHPGYTREYSKGWLREFRKKYPEKFPEYNREYRKRKKEKLQDE